MRERSNTPPPLPLLLLTLALGACGGAQLEPALPSGDPPMREERVGTSPLVAVARPPGPLTRAEARALVNDGLGVVLARVEVEPVVRGSTFVGFRLVAARDLAAWNAAGVDVRLNDVVVRINGQRIERPEQAMWAFQQLRIAPEIAVELLRDGATVVTRTPIIDEQPAAPQPSARATASATPPPSSGGTN